MQCDTECNTLDYTFPLCNPEEMNMYSAQLNGVAILRLRDFVSSVCKLDVGLVKWNMHRAGKVERRNCGRIIKQSM